LLVDRERTGISRDDFLVQMTAENIGVGVHYLSIPEHIYYQREFGWNPLDFPQAMEVGRNTVSLPISPKLTEEDVEDIILAMKKVILR
jgi:dTDP-4-amino-4,6-dideoxygalactose transaminase